MCACDLCLPSLSLSPSPSYLARLVPFSLVALAPTPAGFSAGRHTDTLSSPMCGPVTRAPVSPPRCPLHLALNLPSHLPPFSERPSSPYPPSPSLPVPQHIALGGFERYSPHPPQRAYCTVHCNYARSPEIYSPLETRTTCVCRTRGVWECPRDMCM